MATDGAPRGLRENEMRKHTVVIDGHSPCYRSLCFLVLIAPLGCAHTLPPPPLSDATLAHLGTIGVVSAQVTPEMDYRTPERGGAAGAAIGTAKGLGLGTLGAAGCFLTYGQFLAGCGLAVVSPYLAVRYAVDQATAGVSADAIEAAETAIKAVLAEPNPQAMARDELYRVAAAHTGQPLVLLPDQGPTTPSETSRYRHLADEGVNTVLEITVQRIALRHQGAAHSIPLRISATDLNPDLTLVVTTQRRVVKTADGTELYRHTGDHGGSGATFTEWGANDAQLLREGLDQLLREIAGEIVSQVFGVSVPPAIESAAPAKADQDTEPEPKMSSSPSEAERASD